jgi:hypothetical protein
MRHSQAAREFGRDFLRTVEQMSGGEWVAGRDVFTATIGANPENDYVRYITENTARQIKVTFVVDDCMRDEFPYIEKKKVGPQQQARVYFRTTTGASLVAEPSVSRSWFERWQSALRDEARQVSATRHWLAAERVLLEFQRTRAGPDGALDARLTLDPLGSSWAVEINQPRETGNANSLSAIGIRPDGEVLLLRQAWLRAAEGGREVREQEFQALTGLEPTRVRPASGPTNREWYIVARLDADPEAIALQTGRFVKACHQARSGEAAVVEAEGPHALGYAAPERGGAYVIGPAAVRDAREVLRLQGEVWCALAEQLGPDRLQKRRHTAGYEVDAEVVTTPRPLLVEIKTGVGAAEIYTGVGQLILYAELMRMSEHLPVLLIPHQPMNPALYDAVVAAGIAVHRYAVEAREGEAAPIVSFDPAFLALCGCS